MRKSLSSLLGFTVLLFVGCATGDQKIPEMATDFCNCFSNMERNLSANTKSIWQKAANADDPESTMKTETQKLSEEDQAQVQEDMKLIGETNDKDSEVGRCMAAIEKKYENAKTLDETKSLKKLIKELESKTGCKFTASLMKIEMRVKEKKGN